MISEVVYDFLQVRFPKTYFLNLTSKIKILGGTGIFELYFFCLILFLFCSYGTLYTFYCLDLPMFRADSTGFFNKISRLKYPSLKSCFTLNPSKLVQSH